MKPATLKPIEIGYGEEKFIFYPAMATVAEEEELNQKFNDVSDSDTDKFQKQFEYCRDGLAQFSSEIPVKLVKVKGELVKQFLIENAESAKHAIDTYFAERTPENERVIRTAYQLLKLQWQPDNRFL